MAGKLKVCIIGAEGWGTAIAAAVSKNVMQKVDWDFDSRVHIYVYDDPIRNNLLSEVINSRHENVKYLPGIKLPRNLTAVNDLLEAAQNADILIFSTPQSFVKSYCNILAGNVKETAFAVSMIKGLVPLEDDKLGLVSHAISERLDIPCYSMMSAHSSMEMAQGKLCEVTVGCSDAVHSELLTAVLQTNNCRVISINDVDGVELCGTLKDIIGLGAGFVDGLRLGENARVAAIHLCLKEMMRFTKTFFPTAKMSTFYETCGIAHSVAATYVDKNVNFAKSFITTGKTFEEMESTFLNGRKLLGPVVAADVNVFLEKELRLHEFPLFTAIHRICQNEAPPEVMLDALRNHPDLSSSISNLLSKESAAGEDSVLQQVADTLPKLRSCLDRILAEANSPNIKQLKIMDDWSQVDEHKVEKLGMEDSPIETEDMPSQLSAKASRIRDEIREGNVRVAFKMDANEGGQHVRLLLEESPEMSSQSVISSRSDKGESKGHARLDKGQFLDSTTNYMEDKGWNDNSDVLDLSSEETSQLMDEEEAPRSLEKAKLEANNEDQEVANLKVQENLIKSIRKTIEALGNNEKMETLIAESRMEEENSPFARFKVDENQSPDEATEMQQQPAIKGETEAPNEPTFAYLDEPLEQEHIAELRLHHDVEAAMDEVPALEQKDNTFSKEIMELEEVIQWQKLKLDEDSHQLELEEKAKQDVEEKAKQDAEEAELQVRAHDMETGEAEDEKRPAPVGDRKPHQNLQEVNVRHFRDKKAADAGRHEWDWLLNHDLKEPKETQEVLADFQAKESQETLSQSDREKLVMLNVQLKEALQRDMDVMTTGWEEGSHQELGEEKELAEEKELVEEKELIEEKELAEEKELVEEKNLDVEKDLDIEKHSDDKRVTHEPSIPLPVKVPAPKKHYREGTPDFQTQPGGPTFPQTTQPRPRRLQPQRSNPPVEFGYVHEGMQPEEAYLDQMEPEAKGSSKAEPPSEPPSKRGRETPRPPAKKMRTSPGDPETPRTEGRPTTPKSDEHREFLENQKSQLSRPGRKSNSVIRRGKDRQVDFRGRNPFTEDPDLEAKPPMDTSFEEGRKEGKKDDQGLSHQRRKVVVSPPFNPPINPRVRLPRPPFDARDHHTMTALPASKHFAPAVRWPPTRRNLNHSPRVASAQVKPLGALPSQVRVTSRPISLQMPSGVPRTPTLTKILCALQIGLLATYLARYKRE